jgi:hypothetical protein
VAQINAAAENNFALTADKTIEYARADSLVSEAELVTFNPSVTDAIAEVNLVTNGAAKSDSTLTSRTTVTFNSSDDGSFNLAFDATPYQQVAISEPTGQSVSTMAASVTLTETSTGNVLTWFLTGASDDTNCSGSPWNNIAGVTCNIDSEPFSLNSKPSIGNPTTTTLNPGTGSFSLTVSGLPDGEYSVGLSTTVTVSVRREVATVPEPGSMALVGLGLLGMGIGLRRRIRNI